MSQSSVLVFETTILNRLGIFQGYSLQVEKYLSDILDPKNNFFMNRKRAEYDPRFKQLIPYVVLRFDNLIFSYVRGEQSREGRLLSKLSIGLGGHIEQLDQRLTSSDQHLYLSAARREVDEEVYINSVFKENIIALINDDSNEVGRVHFGILHIWDLAEPNVKAKEKQITHANFTTIEELKARYTKLETWSQIALNVLEVPSSLSIN